jgi:hypothetical protein
MTYYLIFAIILILASCSSKQTTNYSSLAFQSPASRNSFPALCEAPPPKAGKAAICGVLRSTYMDPPNIPKTAFFFMRAKETGLPAILTGPNVERGDIQGVSDERGEISLDDIPPGNYYIVVWAPYTWVLAVQSPEDLTPRLVVLEADKRYMLGIIYVPWP